MVNRGKSTQPTKDQVVKELKKEKQRVKDLEDEVNNLRETVNKDEENAQKLAEEKMKSEQLEKD